MPISTAEAFRRFRAAGVELLIPLFWPAEIILARIFRQPLDRVEFERRMRAYYRAESDAEDLNV